MAGRTVYIETFGCQMNELDSELVSGQLRALGYAFTEEPDRADVVLYNTCSVRDHAEQKVRSRLGELRERRASDPGLVVGVLGCMAERDGRDMIARFPVIDVLCGPGELDKLPALLDNAVRTRGAIVSDPDSARERFVALQGGASRRSATLAAAADSLELLDLSRAVSPDDHSGSAYVRITRGCNKFCTYCVVPHTRGAEVHRPPDHIVDECKRLADAGVVEVTLLGQTVNHYRFEHGAVVTMGGIVQPQKGRAYAGGHRRDPFEGERVTTFAGLLRRIHEEAPGIARLRFVTSYPRDFGDDVLEVIRDSPRICRYLHVPAQSGSDAVLARMNRGYTVGEYLEFIDRARGVLDEPEKGRPLSIAGDIIAGFCAETEDDHRATAALLRRVRYKNCFIFRYSPRPGTAAFDRLADDVPEEDKRRRVNELLALQQSISDEVSREQVGREFEVFVQGVSAHEAKREPSRGRVPLTVGGRASEREASAPVVQLSARTEGDLIVVFDCPAGRSGAELVGSLVRVKITAARGLTLFGVLP
ncbi:MAG TPA: tRNA (N6-isopentenyl adenosine(37)-C2)-methylthiotransferase MiaB [Phycisphaerales bacterium]|nr:tRNA (N6-isopentenyl adenosine(37)-C2)-methylthiotransferase MiaB [Phycisphaerales bacterium]